MQEVEAEVAQQLTVQRSSSIKTDVFAPSNIQPGYLMFKFAAWGIIGSAEALPILCVRYFR